ncbi:MAG: hypothetical protein AAGE37_07870 [Pseudomonadota bacterium]
MIAKIPNILDGIDHNNRHAELASASIVPFQNLSDDQKWTLKQVQGDELGGVA